MLNHTRPRQVIQTGWMPNDLITILYEPLAVFEARWPSQPKISCFRAIRPLLKIFGFFWRPDNNLNIFWLLGLMSAAVWTLLGETLEILSVHQGQIFENFHQALPFIFRGPQDTCIDIIMSNSIFRDFIPLCSQHRRHSEQLGAQNHYFSCLETQLKYYWWYAFSVGRVCNKCLYWVE